MGSPLGALMAKAFLCSIKEKLEQDNKIPEFYRRYVDDTFATMKNVPATEQQQQSLLYSYFLKKSYKIERN